MNLYNQTHIMLQKYHYWSLILLLFFIIGLFVGCSDDTQEEKEAADIWDIEKKGIPKFIEIDYIELEKIYRISRFRSSIGHDYSDAFEDCRSMKHYFQPKSEIDWSTVKIYSPVNGKITRLDQEWAGIKIEIESEDYPAFRFVIFHVNLQLPLQLNDKINAGEELGTHIGSQTMSDIAVIVNDPTRQGRMVSYFDVITDAVFMHYSQRGINSRQELIISREERDAHPLTCEGDAFISADSLEGWVVLN